MANQNNGDSYVLLNPTIEALKKEKEATEWMNEKLLDRIVEEKQRIQWIREQEEVIKELKRQRDITEVKNEFGKRLKGVNNRLTQIEGTLFAVLERMDAQAPAVEPNPEENLEDDPEENLGDDLGVDPVIDIEDDQEEDPNGNSRRQYLQLQDVILILE
ncbi:hypothetical protein ACH5RR_000694 [Cinchona calisaya]|uniref:Uncharacterized protein n=1 Tax=Cinchona calisaya TaxID=153742 RepID=A0ABD3B1X8_9GENT